MGHGGFQLASRNPGIGTFGQSEGVWISSTVSQSVPVTCDTEEISVGVYVTLLNVRLQLVWSGFLYSVTGELNADGNQSTKVLMPWW